MRRCKFKYMMKINKCKYCGCLPVITDDHGIGDIYCPNGCGHTRIINGYCVIDRFHFSGKFCIKKRDALRKWNEENGGSNED